MRALFVVVVVGLCLSVSTNRDALAKPTPAVEWLWDDKSPAPVVVNPKEESKTYTISAKGKVVSKKGVVIESVRFLIVYSQSAVFWEIEPAVDVPATLGKSTEVEGDKTHSSQTATCDRIPDGKGPLVIPAKFRLKVVARIRYKESADAKESVVGDFDAPRVVTTPAD